jgi:hypothetical protein
LVVGYRRRIRLGAQRPQDSDLMNASAEAAVGGPVYCQDTWQRADGILQLLHCLKRHMIAVSNINQTLVCRGCIVIQ